MITLLQVAVLGVAAFGQAPPPAKIDDPLLVGTVWKGELTQQGVYKGASGAPPKFDCEFTITRRVGTKFEADLFEKTPDLKLTYIVRGTITPVEMGNPKKGYAVTFESVGFKDVDNTSPLLNITYKGKLKEKEIEGSWVYPANSEGTTLKGSFEFERKKK